jgi:uncharacterized metal-binding protein/DNA-binding transcriptional ArsR family regulator
MNPLTRAKYQARANAAKALAHPTRLFILDEIGRGERSVRELTRLIGADISTVSKHLGVLRHAGLVSDEKRGLLVYYRLCTPCVNHFFNCLEAALCTCGDDRVAAAPESVIEAPSKQQGTGSGGWNHRMEEDAMKSGITENLIFACSGAADVGGIADHAARRLSREGGAAFCCAAAVAAGVPSVLERAAWAGNIVVIDGCDNACARKILEEAGRHKCHHVNLGVLGLKKGFSPASEANIALAVDAARCELSLAH